MLVNGEKLEAFLLRSGKEKDGPSHHFFLVIISIILEVLANGKRGVSKRCTDWDRRNKPVFTCRSQDCSCRKN